MAVGTKRQLQAGKRVRNPGVTKCWCLISWLLDISLLRKVDVFVDSHCHLGQT